MTSASPSATPMRRRAFLTGALGAASLLSMGHSPYRRWYQYRARHTVIAADRADARSFPLAERLVSRLAARRPQLNATATRSQDPRTLVSLLKTRQLDLALLRGEDAYQALTGVGPYSHLTTPIRALGSVAPEYLHVVVSGASAVRIFKDLEGQRIGIAEALGRAGVKARRVAATFGLDHDADLRWRALEPETALAELAAGVVSAWCFEAPLPAADLAAGRRPAGLRLRLIPHGDAVDAIAAHHGPIYFRATLPADRYPDLDAGAEALGEVRLLVCRDDYPAERARAIAEALEGWDELAPPRTPLPIPAHAALAAIQAAP